MQTVYHTTPGAAFTDYKGKGTLRTCAMQGCWLQSSEYLD